LSEEQRRVVDHAEGPLLVLGAAGSGRTEALAHRLARLAAAGDGALALTCSHAGAARLRSRAEEAIEAPFEEIACQPHRAAAVRLLAEHAEEAGLDPFIEPLGCAERIALLLDRTDELPLRRHEIRGNPSGLLARLVARIDALKAAGVTAARFRGWAEKQAADAADRADADVAEREREFSELYEIHDSVVREAGCIDGGEAVLELTRLLVERPSLARTIAGLYPHLIVDELEDASPAELEMIGALAAGAASAVLSCDDAGGGRGDGGGSGWARRELGVPDEVELTTCRRHGPNLADAAHAVIAPTGRGSEAPPRSGELKTSVAFWRCENDRAEAQAVAREIESMLGAGETPPSEVCVAVTDPEQARAVGAALEERRVPHRLSGRGAFLQRPEVRDVIAWLRMLADPIDAAAAVRALSRPPVELRSVDLARCTSIARRRKLDMVSALEASLESPQIPPEARDRIRSFLDLYGAAAKAMGELRADVFVRRLIERIGFRRQRLFAGHAETAERLRNLSRLGALAEGWARREPSGSNREFVRYLVAISESGVPPEDEEAGPSPEAVRISALEQLKGLEFETMFIVGMEADAISGAGAAAAPAVPPELGGSSGSGEDARRSLLYTAMTRARRRLVLARAETGEAGALRPAAAYEDARAVLAAEEEPHAEELFGPAEDLHATYRMMQDEVLEEAWRAGATLGEPRLDTYMDVSRAVARFLEVVKLAALLQRQGPEPAPEALAAVNDLLAQSVSPEQREALAASGLDEYLLETERERHRRQDLVAAREEPSLAAFLPRRGEGLALSATDIDLYRTCPLKYKFARVFSIPQEQTINQRFGIVIHQVLERFHKPSGQAGEGGGEDLGDAGSLERLMSLFSVAWRRAGFGESDDELQFRERAVEALRRYHARTSASGSSPRWVERKFDFRVGRHHLRGRVDRVDELPGGGYELIDYKTGDPKPERELASDVQLAIYRLAAREAWNLEAAAGSYWYVLADEKVAVGGSPDERERVEAVVLEVGEGILGQDFEPRPSPEICSWCDFRLLCPASEA
jgi:DNA helicase-2/ATP-dependent DNA helicase PcrA